MAEVIKILDFQETMKSFGVTASIEGELPASMNGVRHPLLKELDELYAGELLRSASIAYPLSPKGVAVTAQFPVGSRLGLRFPGGIEASAVVAVGTNAGRNILELGTLSKRDASGKVWVPPVAKKDEDPFLFALATTPATDEHESAGIAPTVGRHYAGGLLAIYGQTEVANYLNADGENSLINGPDALEDLTKPQNAGRRTLLSRGSAGPGSERAGIPVANDFFPVVNPRLVATHPPYAWIQDVLVVIHRDAVDYASLRDYRIQPKIVERHPEVALGDVIISTAALEYGTQETIGKLERVVEQTMRLKKGTK